jgi:predicted GIY-YIG superfamily endonuclease
MYFVYVLIDPRDDAVRYVGMTNDVYTRFSQHLRGDGNNISKNMWIAELRELNLMVIMRTIETVETQEEVREREAYWIRHYSSQGSDLLNLTGAKSLTYETFMSFFQDSPVEETDINDELPQITATPPVKRSRPGPKLKRNVYTVSESARLVRCSMAEIRAALDSGKLVRAKNSDKILKSSLEKFSAEKRSGKSLVK